MKFLFRTMALAGFSAFLIQAAPAKAEPGGCTSSSVLSFIDSRFDSKAARYLHSDIDIIGLDRVGTGRFEGRNATHSVERQYCHVRATMSDGRKRTIWYLIERNWAFAGLGTSVEFCVSGLDPWRIYGRDCRSLR